jgi:hypothetical protein
MTPMTPSRPSPPLDQPGDSAAMATVFHGPFAAQLPVAGLTVGEIRRRYREYLDIAPRSQAVLDGQDTGEETLVRAGQNLLFIARCGSIGE